MTSEEERKYILALKRNYVIKVWACVFIYVINLDVGYKLVDFLIFSYK
jgi:hypothetical protein